MKILIRSHQKGDRSDQFHSVTLSVKKCYFYVYMFVYSTHLNLLLLLMCKNLKNVTPVQMADDNYCYCLGT